MADATNTVASKIPTSKFAIVDFPADGLKDKPKNVVRACSSTSRRRATWPATSPASGPRTTTPRSISSVGGQKIPPVDHYIAGYQAGAKKAYPGIETLNGYSQDFVDQAKCKEIALDQIAKGSKVVFQVAGRLRPRRARRRQGEGRPGHRCRRRPVLPRRPHPDQRRRRRSTWPCSTRSRASRTATFKGGTDVVNTVANDGVGIGEIGPAGQKYADQVEEIQQQIKRRQDQGHPRHGQVAGRFRTR